MNGTGSFLGSYHVHIEPTGDGNLLFTVTNNTGLESATRSPFANAQSNPTLQTMIQNGAQGSNYWGPKAVLNNTEWGSSYSAFGVEVGGTLYQTYEWQE